LHFHSINTIQNPFTAAAKIVRIARSDKPNCKRLSAKRPANLQEWDRQSRPTFRIQGRSIMSVFGQITRIFFLVAVGCSVAFAATHPNRFSSIPALQQDSVPDTLFLPDHESRPLSEPASLTSTEISHIEDALLSPQSLAGRTPDINSMDTPGDRVQPQLSLLTPNPTNPSDDAVLGREPFGLPTIIAPPGEIAAKWNELQSRLLADEKTLAACRLGENECSQAARRFWAIVELGQKHQGRAKFGWINRAVNLNIKPMSDWAQYGYADYWASPLQTLSSGAGDCEDYAIVKYAALRELGIAPGDLRLVIVQDSMHQAEHAVVAVRDEQKWLILDNRTMAMLDAEQARYYYPLFVMDYRGIRTISTAARR
jgi:predicted transglutaminase-like cysteine proteinase